MTKTQRLMDAIMSESTSLDRGVLANELLREFHRGYPVEKLRCLLSNREEQVVKAGIWIASELGSKGTPLLDDVVKLLNYSTRYVRYFAIDSLLTCTTGRNENEISAVILMLYDGDKVIRWKVLDFLTRASIDQIQGAINWFEKNDPGSAHLTGLQLLLNGQRGNVKEALLALQSENPIIRKYGVVLAARMIQISVDPLMLAISINDEDICTFAQDSLKSEKKSGRVS